MKLNKVFLFIFVLVQMATPVFAATVYKWIDEDGHVHYESKAQHKNAKEIIIKDRYIDSGNATVPESAQDRVNKQKKFLNAVDEENKSVADMKRKKREKEELKITRCNASRDQLKRYESSGALYDLDEKGNRILLNKKQYEQAMAQAKARVEKWCN